MKRNTVILLGVGAVGVVWFLWRKKKRAADDRPTDAFGREKANQQPELFIGSGLRSVIGKAPPMKPNPRDRKFCYDHCGSYLSYGRECAKRKCKELYPGSFS